MSSSLAMERDLPRRAGGAPPANAERESSSQEPAEAHADWKPSVNPWLIAFTVMLSTFLEVLDTSVANVALPNMAGSLASSNDEALWVLTSYLVANAIILPAASWLATFFGRKRFLIVCIVLFTVSSALCGAATSLGMLILARIAQGAGGGALMPLSQTILLESFPKKKHGQAMALFGLGVIVAPILGPVIGGWITDNYSWRWIFYINVPIGILAAVMSQAFLEDPPHIRNARPTSVDGIGFALLAIWVGTLQIILDKGQQDDWFQAPWICWSSAVCVVSLVAWIVWELRVAHPIVDLRTLRNRNLAVGTPLFFMVGAVLYGTTATIPLYLQTLMGYTSYLAGVALTPRGILAALGMIMVAPLMTRMGARVVIAVGFSALGLSCWALSGINLSIDMRGVVVPAMLSGVGMSFIFVPLTTLANSTLAQEEIGNASGLTNLARNIGGGVGISLNSTFIARYAQAHQGPLASHLSPYNPQFQDSLQQTTQWFGTQMDPVAAASAGAASMYGQLVQQANLLAFMDVFVAMAIICFACVPLAFLFKAGRQSQGAAMMH